MPESRTVDVQTFLNEHPFSGYQWTIFALCFFVVLLDGFDTAAIGYIAPSLLTEWGVERPALAPVLSAALFGLAAGALAAGPLADRSLPAVFNQGTPEQISPGAPPAWPQPVP
jgi:MFS transporter, AAHS family, 4-hydroxybenzoate transporter